MSNLTDGTGYTVIHSYHDQRKGHEKEWLCVDVPMKKGDTCSVCGTVA